MTSIEKTNFLLDKVEEKLKSTTYSSLNLPLRESNLLLISKLFERLKIQEKHTDFKTIFNYTAMNLAGIGLKNDDFGKIRKGKYVQIIAISYDIHSSGRKVTKNSSLGYYGKAEKLQEQEKNDIIEFVLRWRYEKSFKHSDDYQQLLEKLH